MAVSIVVAVPNYGHGYPKGPLGIAEGGGRWVSGGKGEGGACACLRANSPCRRLLKNGQKVKGQKLKNGQGK